MQEFDAKESSNIKWARYYPEEQRLEIDFSPTRDGIRLHSDGTSTYEYRNFSAVDWKLFQAAESKGKHFARAIRFAKNDDGSLKYPYAKLAGKNWSEVK